MQTEWTYASMAASRTSFTLTPGGTATYSEVDDMAQWGSAVYCTQPGDSKVSSQIGYENAVRSNFVAKGSLSTANWSWAPGSVVAFSHDLGTVVATHNVTYAIGYTRESEINYMGQARAGYWRSIASDIHEACVRALDDFSAADLEARELDEFLANAATNSAGDNYSDTIALSVRQVFGALDITIPQATLDTTEVLAFVKEISSDGNVNTIDVIYPMSPILYVLAPEYIRLLLQPIVSLPCLDHLFYV